MWHGYHFFFTLKNHVFITCFIRRRYRISIEVKLWFPWNNYMKARLRIPFHGMPFTGFHFKFSFYISISGQHVKKMCILLLVTSLWDNVLLQLLNYYSMLPKNHPKYKLWSEIILVLSTCDRGHTHWRSGEHPLPPHKVCAKEENVQCRGDAGTASTGRVGQQSPRWSTTGNNTEGRTEVQASVLQTSRHLHREAHQGGEDLRLPHWAVVWGSAAMLREEDKSAPAACSIHRDRQHGDSCHSWRTCWHPQAHEVRGHR